MSIYKKPILQLTATSIAILLFLAFPLIARAASGTIDMNLTYVGVGIGYHGGDATVSLNGKSAAFKVKGGQFLGAGISRFHATGAVTGANSMADIEGRYKITRASIAVVAGAVKLSLKNDKGVTMELNATNLGVDLSVGMGFLTFSKNY
ncbi:MAG: hypothetical protein Q9M08_02810 [Mariprofundus sp.]|nr:hypothetical protein [Mariprofundus sp.]